MDRHGLIVTLVLLPIAPLMVMPEAPLAGNRPVCSMIAFSGFQMPYETVFLAVPLADTVQAADGQPPFERFDRPLDRGHRFHTGPPLPGLEREPVLSGTGTFGQLAKVTRYQGYGADTLEAVLADGVSEAVLVPWGYDPACQLTRWTGSFRWSTPGQEGLFKAWMRAPDRWIDGRPTFDVRSTTHTPYPHAYWYELRRDRYDDWLSPLDLFELLAARPQWSDSAGGPASDVSRLQAWRREHPDFEGHYPVPTVLRDAYAMAEVDRVHRLDSPVAGTYRLDIQADGESHALYIRTSAHPSTPVRSDRPDTRTVPEAPWRSSSHFLAISGAGDVADILPLLQGPSGARCQHRYAMRVSEAYTVHGDSLIWSAEVSPRLISKCIGGSEGMDAWDQAIEGRWSQGSPPYLGRIVAGPDGSMRFEQGRMEGDLESRITGVRVSDEVLNYEARPIR